VRACGGSSGRSPHRGRPFARTQRAAAKLLADAVSLVEVAMSITSWFAVGCALTLGASGLTMGAARASDASADAAAARAFNVGSTIPIPDPGRRDGQVSSGAGADTELVALGASDGANDAAAARAKASAGGAAGLALSSPMGSAARATEPFGPLGASDASSDAYVARAGTQSSRSSSVSGRQAEVAKRH
jgi:hypothetical protein